MGGAFTLCSVQKNLMDPSKLQISWGVWLEKRRWNNLLVCERFDKRTVLPTFLLPASLETIRNQPFSQQLDFCARTHAYMSVQGQMNTKISNFNSVWEQGSPPFHCSLALPLNSISIQFNWIPYRSYCADVWVRPDVLKNRQSTFSPYSINRRHHTNQLITHALALVSCCNRSTLPMVGETSALWHFRPDCMLI